MFTRVILSLVFILLFANSLQCRDTTRQWPVSIAVYSNSVALPGHGNMILFSVPVHPGIYMGTEYFWRSKPKSELFQTAGLSMYVIREMYYGIAVSSAFGSRYYIPCGIFYEGSLGVGYLHTFNYGPVFSLDENGEYQRKTDWGRPHFTPEIAAGAGYRFTLKNENQLSVFIRYQLKIEYPFTTSGEIPFLPHINFYLGARFHMFR